MFIKIENNDSLDKIEFIGRETNISKQTKRENRQK